MKKWLLIAMLAVFAIEIFPSVIVSVKPLYLLVKELYSGEVSILIDPNENPHMFSLTP